MRINEVYFWALVIVQCQLITAKRCRSSYTELAKILTRYFLFRKSSRLTQVLSKKFVYCCTRVISRLHRFSSNLSIIQKTSWVRAGSLSCSVSEIGHQILFSTVSLKNLFINVVTKGPIPIQTQTGCAIVQILREDSIKRRGKLLSTNLNHLIQLFNSALFYGWELMTLFQAF